jgi:hypothetical protein
VNPVAAHAASGSGSTSAAGDSAAALAAVASRIAAK